MPNEHDDNRPLSQRMKDGSYKPSPELAEHMARQEKQDEIARRLVDTPPAPASKVTLSPEQIEEIAEAVANKVIAALKREGVS
jgi:ribosomal protein L19E